MCTWKRLEQAAAIALLLTVVVCAAECLQGVKEQQSMAGKLVRLHVLAHSDDPADQQRKLLVKDAVFARTEEILRCAATQQEAEAQLEAALPELKALAEETLRQDGREETVELALLTERFATRHYENFTLPAGEYRSLQLIIGDGAGQNWWCVVFPPLCSSGGDVFAAAAQAGLSEEEIRLIQTGEAGYRIRFRTVELWNRWMESMAKEGSGE